MTAVDADTAQTRVTRLLDDLYDSRADLLGSYRRAKRRADRLEAALERVYAWARVHGHDGLAADLDRLLDEADA